MTYYEYIRAIRASDLDTNSRILAIMIASHYDFTKGDPTWVSNKTLAKETGLSIRSIVRAKRVLTESHYLASQRQYNSVCLLTPIVPESQGDGQSGQLNTHINTHINTKRNTHINIDESSNEDSYNLLNIEAEELPSVINNNIWEIFENEDKEKARAAAAPRLSTKSNRYNRYNDKRSKTHRTTNTEINQFVEEVGRRRQEEW